ncbi:DUF1810 family protein [Sphingobium sufflavum]|uniref:DUF1810 family protein n=1 Tax=Sphingobium sufflavum TaxID=1129547 RepID=UPI002DD41EEA|nr:DUF1810 family protein [Sphingobium sufflavum]
MFSECPGAVSRRRNMYALSSLAEAQAYLAHPVRVARLRACVTALQDLPITTIDRVFGSMDALKLRSSLTLFVLAGGRSLFEAALERWFDGDRFNLGWAMDKLPSSGFEKTVCS